MSTESKPSASLSTNRPTVAILLTPAMRKQVVPPAAEEKLAAVANIRAAGEGELSAENLPHLLEGATAAITGWGTPSLDELLLARLPSLKLLAHAAGSVRKLAPLAAIEEGRLQVTHAASQIGSSVVEFVISQTLSFLRNPSKLNDGMKAGESWFDLRERYLGRLLGAQTVGLVGAGYVGRLMIGLFRAFGARVLVSDPYLSVGQAAELGVELCDLNDLFRSSDIVSLHVPSLPETHRMIGKAQLALLRDGALFINTARGTIVDETALIEALQQNRFTAILDVYENEPLPADSIFRTLTNAIISPHAAGHTLETRLRQGSSAVDEVCLFLAGKPLRYEVTKSILATMA